MKKCKQYKFTFIVTRLKVNKTQIFRHSENEIRNNGSNGIPFGSKSKRNCQYNYIP